MFHTCLLTYSACIHSPVVDEPAHLASGLAQLETGRTHLYRVNPPLFRLVAAAAVQSFVQFHLPPLAPGGTSSVDRWEFELGDRLILLNGERIFTMMRVARLACLPFSAVGLLAAAAWSRELFGRRAALLTAWLWCFSPFFIGHGSLITPDAAAASAVIAASYFFYRWLVHRRRGGWMLAGAALGMALCTKTTLLILLGIFPAIALVYLLATRRLAGAWQLAGILLLGWTMLAAVYRFDGIGQPLAELDFQSRTLQNALQAAGGNWPSPFPVDYLVGLDQQMCDLEKPTLSYLRGVWRRDGWWYYYVYGLFIKEPLGVWVIMAFSAAFAAARAARNPRWIVRARAWRGLAFLPFLAIPITILVSASSYTGMNHHVRYVLPVLPFVYVAGSALVASGRWMKGLRLTLAAVCGGWLAVSSLLAYPHSLAYLNEAGGGRSGVVFQLNNSNTDWGQDLLLAAKWAETNVRGRDLYLAYYGRVPPVFAGLSYEIPPMLAANATDQEQRGTIERLRPGIYLVSVSLLQGRPFVVTSMDGTAIPTELRAFSYFQRLPPMQMVGQSIVVIEVTGRSPTR